MAKPRDAKSELLRLALWDELKRGNIHEADVRDKAFHIDGLCDGRKVYVNPAPSVVESLLHELAHRRFPAWNEQRVLAESRRLLGKLTEVEVRRWYRTFQTVAKKRKTPVRTDDE